LAGFPENGSQTGRLHVFDYVRHVSYWSTPRKAAKRRDQYRGGLSHDPSALEKALADVEGRLAPELNKVRAEGRICSKSQVPGLLSLVALIHARGPRIHEGVDNLLSRTVTRDLLVRTIDPARWSAIREAELQVGTPERLIPAYDEALRLAEAGRWTFPPPKSAHRELLAVSWETVEQALLARRWSLWRAPEGSGGFICSDCPLSSLVESGFYLAPLNDPNVLITCPISKNLALVSLPGLKQANHEASELVVADVNPRTKLASCGMLYSPQREFLLKSV
jgi:hypothetical protein